MLPDIYGERHLLPEGLPSDFVHELLTLKHELGFPLIQILASALQKQLTQLVLKLEVAALEEEAGLVLGDAFFGYNRG